MLALACATHRILDSGLKSMKVTSATTPCTARGWSEGERGEYFRTSIQLMRENQHQLVFEETARILSEHPADAETWNLLGVAASVARGIGEAVVAFQRAIEFKPGYVEAWQNYAASLASMYRMTESIAAYQRLLELKPDPAHHSSLLFLLQKVETDPQRLFEAHLEFGRLYGGGDDRPHAFRNELNPDRRLRIGYVSGDLREHSVAYFIEPILAHHDHDRFEIHAFSNGAFDHTSIRLQEHCDHWHDITRLTDEQLFHLIRKLRIDILVDLSGHTNLNRLSVFGRRAAPVQITWFGYMATTGLREMDYRLTDSFMSHPETQGFYTETLHNLPGPGVWSPAPEAPPVAPPPCLRNGDITFASLNNFSKITFKVLETWGQLMASVPDAVLVIVARGAGTSVFQQPLLEHFAQFNAAARLVFVEEQPLEIFLALFDHIDIALDPFPYNGGTTSLHTLWSGVPIVTLSGKSEVERSGEAFLRNVGLAQILTARTTDEYVQIAAHLASKPETLAQWRKEMRGRLQRSELMNFSARTRQLESAFREFFSHYCERARNGSGKPKSAR